jgi:hypothetical protein
VHTTVEIGADRATRALNAAVWETPTVTRHLAPAELRQRAQAALKHGAFSGGLVGDLTKKRYQGLRWRFSSALRRSTGSGEATWRELQALRDVARFDVLIMPADLQLEREAHPLVDPQTHQPWPLVERRDGWLAQRTKSIALLRDVGIRDFDRGSDVPALLRRPRRGRGATLRGM